MNADLRLAATSGAIGFLLGALVAGILGTWWTQRADALLTSVSTLQTVEGAPLMTQAAPPATTTVSASPIADLRARRLAVPVLGIGRDQLRATFDDPRGDSRAHEALDILAPTGTPVVAVENGTIAKLFLSEAGGITIYQFDPTGRFAYYYAHLDAYAPELRDGHQVTQGQIIGFVGATGNAPKETPHLHFAIFELTEARRWWEGNPIDPYAVLR
jgi:murein DD-endopeptidase MepM/ murein hydrolase activator NlpD